MARCIHDFERRSCAMCRGPSRPESAECRECGRRLYAEMSIKLGAGPECFKTDRRAQEILWGEIVEDIDVYGCVFWVMPKEAAKEWAPALKPFLDQNNVEVWYETPGKGPATSGIIVGGPAGPGTAYLAFGGREDQ